MTVAVGFKCKDGLVLAADSEICLGPGGKKYAASFREIRIADSVCMICTGNVHRTEEMAEDLRNAIRGKTGRQLTEAVKAACRAIWRENGPEPHEPQEAFGDFLITIDCGEGVSLFRAGRGRFAEVKTYSVLGVERERASAIFERFYRRGADSTLTAYMVIHSLAQAKVFVPGCGGQTRVWKISSGLFHRQYMSEADIHRAEKAYELFEHESARALFKFPDPLVSSKEFKSLQRRFGITIQRLRPVLLKEEKSEQTTKTRSSRGTSQRTEVSVPSKPFIQFKTPAILENAAMARNLRHGCNSRDLIT